MSHDLSSAREECRACAEPLPVGHQGACPNCGHVQREAPSTDLAVRHAPKVLIRDLLIFELKLFVDGVGDVVMSQLAVVATILDLVLGGRKRGNFLYSVLRWGEKWDLWLNLYGRVERANRSREGLLGGASNADDLIGKVEEMVEKESKGLAESHRRRQDRKDI